jgi:lipid-binding SYLF domain-containing protein
MNAILDTRFTTIKFFLVAFCLFFITACGGTTHDTSKGGDTGATALTAEQKNKEQKHILQTVEKTLQELYKKKPASKKLIEKSYGYAVFSNTGYNIFLYVGGKGKGVAFKNSDKKPIFMTMLNAGTGPGVGYTEYRQILIFDSEDLFKQFITVGVNLSASANATIKLGDANIDESGVVALVPGVSAYHINDKGVDVQANWGGMKYFKDGDLL